MMYHIDQLKFSDKVEAEYKRLMTTVYKAENLTRTEKREICEQLRILFDIKSEVYIEAQTDEMPYDEDTLMYTMQVGNKEFIIERETYNDINKYRKELINNATTK